MFLLHQESLSEVVNILVDGAYNGERFERLTRNILGAKVEVVQCHELHTFAVLPKRWIIERSFAWLEKCRRLWHAGAAAAPARHRCDGNIAEGIQRTTG